VRSSLNSQYPPTPPVPGIRKVAGYPARPPPDMSEIITLELPPEVPPFAALNGFVQNSTAPAGW
jgi:hypothetical protein